MSVKMAFQDDLRRDLTSRWRRERVKWDGGSGPGWVLVDRVVARMVVERSSFWWRAWSAPGALGSYAYSVDSRDIFFIFERTLLALVAARAQK